MILQAHRKLLFLFWLIIGWPLTLLASEIYHWVDADGVNHYSQSPPTEAASKVQTMDVDGSQPANYDPNEDIFNVAAQEKATQAVRDKLAENRKNKQQVQQNTAGNTVIYYPEPSAYSNILYPPAYRPRPPNVPPRPRPPEPRPPNGSLLPDLPEVAPAVPSIPFRSGRP